jgi:hypothetical protein
VLTCIVLFVRCRKNARVLRAREWFSSVVLLMSIVAASASVNRAGTVGILALLPNITLLAAHSNYDMADVVMRVVMFAAGASQRAASLVSARVVTCRARAPVQDRSSAT